MKDRIAILETKVAVTETKVATIESEIELNRTFKHTTNGTLHTQNGKIEVIGHQQNSTAEAIMKLTTVVEGALEKIGNVINLKFMLVGGASVGTVMVIGAYYMFRMFLDYHK